MTPRATVVESRDGRKGRGGYGNRRGAALLFAIGVALLLNVLDSFFTILHLQQGALEWNPALAWLLGYGPGVFVFWKSLVVGLGMAVLGFHSRFRLARAAFFCALLLYGGLLAYQTMFVPPVGQA